MDISKKYYELLAGEVIKMLAGRNIEGFYCETKNPSLDVSTINL
jgi:hypothetical protein